MRDQTDCQSLVYPKKFSSTCFSFGEEVFSRAPAKDRSALVSCGAYNIYGHKFYLWKSLRELSAFHFDLATKFTHLA